MRRRDLLLAAPAAFAEKPNIVLFLSDDHGWFDSSLYGSPAVRTPHLDHIARQGVVFDSAFCNSPACVPSRAILMSGLMSARNGAEANHSRLKPDIPTLPFYLRELGYRVAHFGKGHFQPPENYRDLEFVPSEIKRGPLDNDLDTAAVDRWLATKPSQPVAMFVNAHSPHVYWPEASGYSPAQTELPPSFVDTPETRQFRARYYTDITKMDTQLGAVYNSVQKHLGPNTLFVYTTDNGAQWPFAKWNLYDAGIRVPMVASWPKHLKPGTRTSAMVGFVDFLPTLVDLAGGKVPQGLDGRSFAPVLRGRSNKHREHLFATHSADGNMNVYPMRCLRTERFKYILNLHPEYL